MEYSFKDILSGLRYEYLNIRNRLDNLQKEINIIDSELSKCLVLLNDEAESVACYFYNRKKHIIDAVIDISKCIGLPTFALENLELDSSIKSIYHFKNDLKHYHIIIEDIQGFNEKLFRILTSDFVNMTKSNNIEINHDNQSYLLEIGYNHLGQVLKEFGSGLVSIDYYPKNDLVKLDYIKTLSSEELNKKLNVRYDASLFNDYQKGIIEGHKKDIVLFDEKTTNHEFKIVEEEKRLVLLK